MSFTLHVVDAFTDKPFHGNPAAVCLLDGPQDETWMKLVAREMNLAETAFAYQTPDGYALRWFTPTVEVDLCGHATLATAFVLWHTGKLQPYEPVRFQTRGGMLTCVNHQGWIEMDFPALPVHQIEPPPGFENAIGWQPRTVFSSNMDYLVELPTEKMVRQLFVNANHLATFPVRGLIVTAVSESKDYDFVSRFFAPGSGVVEDPVTGSAHCALGPYWANKLGKNDFVGYQASERGGTVKVSVVGNRAILKGQAVLMSRIELLGGA